MKRYVSNPVILWSAVLLAVALAGCSDDVVCPELVPDEANVYISARLIQISDAGGDLEESTHAELVCTSDPLPTTLISFINGRELSNVGPGEELGLQASFDDDEVLWEPGPPCSLGVTTNLGYATSATLVPFAAEPSAPLESVVAESLTISWDAAAGADYYRVTAMLVPGAYARAGSRDTLVFEINTESSGVTFEPDDLPFTGDLTGVVESVAGPFPEGGSDGNVEGDGWGFFTSHYTNAGSAFSVIIYDPLDRMRPSK
jgi:hypothetical protein